MAKQEFLQPKNFKSLFFMEEIAKKALLKAENLCSRGEKCKHDVIQKLFDWKVPSEFHEQIIEKLVENNFLNEERFVSAFINDKLKFQKWGRKKIEYALSQKHISSALYQQFFENHNLEEYSERLLALLQKKVSQIKAKDKNEAKQKLINFALSKGYEYAVIAKLLNEVIKTWEKEK